MLQFGNMSDELTRYNTKLFGEKVAPGLRTLFSEYDDPWWPRSNAPLMASSVLVYLFGIAGHAELSPAMRAVEAAGGRSSSRRVPGFDGVPGFQPRDEYLDWLTTFWDALDATGAAAVPGRRRLGWRDVRGRARRAASRGRHRARPARAVRHRRRGQPRLQHLRHPAGERMAHLFAKGVPDAVRQPVRPPRRRRRRRSPATSAMSPPPTSCGRFGDRGVAKRLHRITAPRLTLWGDHDEVNPVTNAAAWGGADVIAGAGHLLEWDAPEQVSAALLAFLNSPSSVRPSMMSFTAPTYPLPRAEERVNPVRRAFDQPDVDLRIDLVLACRVIREQRRAHLRVGLQDDHRLVIRASGSYPLSAPPWMAGSHTSGSPSISVSTRLCKAGRSCGRRRVPTASPRRPPSTRRTREACRRPVPAASSPRGSGIRWP